MNFFKFLISRTFFISIAIAIVSFIAIIWVALTILDIYTHNGESLSVPNFTGLTIDEVENLANEHLLRFEVIDSVYINSAAGGTVVEQSPDPDFKVKENRTIFLTVNAMNKEKVPMPKLVNITLRQATSTLETYGLKIGEISYAPDIAKNVVLEQKYKDKNIENNTLIIKGESIDLVLGIGESNEKAIVPSLIGLSIMDVESVLNTNSLNLGATMSDETIKLASDSISSQIWKQSPLANSEISLGSVVDIWITTDSSLVIVPIDTTTTNLQTDSLINK